MAEKGQWREACKHHRKATEENGRGDLVMMRAAGREANKIGGEKGRVMCEEVKN